MKTNVEQWWNHIDRGKLKYSETDHDYIFVAINLTQYKGNSISKLQIQVATYVFELSAGNCHC